MKLFTLRIEKVNLTLLILFKKTLVIVNVICLHNETDTELENLVKFNVIGKGQSVGKSTSRKAERLK